MNSPLLPELPSNLDRYLRAQYSDETLARRAALAPWPWLRFASAWDERELCKSWLGETLAKLRKKKDSDPRLTVWDAHFSVWVQETFPNYL